MRVSAWYPKIKEDYKMKKVRSWVAGLLSATMLFATAPVLKNETVRASAFRDDGEEVQIAIDETNFPDEVFRFLVESYYDTAEPKGILTEDEIAATTEICLNDCIYTITDFTGIEFFTELEYLACNGSGISKLDFSGNTKIKTIWSCRCESLSSIDVTGCTSLEKLYVDGCNALTEVDLSTCSSLQGFQCEGCDGLKNVDLSACHALRFFDCEYCDILESFDVSGCPELTDLRCSYCPLLSALDVSSNPELFQLYCYGCPLLTELDVSSCTKLNALFLDGSKGLTTLDVSKCAALQVIRCMNCDLDEIILGDLPALYSLDCNKNNLTSLDVTGCPKLASLVCSENRISELKINRNPDLRYLRCDGNPIWQIDIYSSPYFMKLFEMDLDPEEGEYDHHDGYNVKYYNYRGYLDDASGESVYCELQVDVDDYFVTEAPEYGISVISDGNGTASASVSAAPEFALVTLTATANEGYAFKEWQVVTGDVTIADPSAATTTFEMGAGNVEIKAVFDLIPQTPEPGPGPVDPTDPTNPQPGRDPSFEDFVERLYVVALGRASEPEGKAFWVDQVVNKGLTGADCARFFMLGAPEFLGRNLTDDEFVEVLYKTYFDRDSEPDGKAYWLGRLASGTERAVLVEEFIESVEWCNVCAMYGVKSGARFHKATVTSKNAVKFATRLYTCCLGRDPEEEGLSYWALALTNLDVSGYTAASCFFTLPEFVGLKTSNEEYLTRLYTTFMGREPEADGFNYWLGLLNGGTAREDVMKAFASCPEFQEICNQYGIERGEI